MKTYPTDPELRARHLEELLKEADKVGAVQLPALLVAAGYRFQMRIAYELANHPLEYQLASQGDGANQVKAVGKHPFTAGLSLQNTVWRRMVADLIKQHRLYAAAASTALQTPTEPAA